MSNVQELYDRWLAQPGLDEAIKAELTGVAGDDEAVTDRFYRDLEFGTGGLRGVIGAGTNRMNLYTVRKATQGLADYLNASDLPKKVAIAHDSRHNGELFARETARVLAANGITAYTYPPLGADARPVVGGAVSRLRRRRLRHGQPQPLPSTTATRFTARTAARSRWKPPRKFSPLLKRSTASTASSSPTTTRRWPTAASS